VSIVVCAWGLTPDELESRIGEPLTLARSLDADVRLVLLGSIPDGATEAAVRFGAKAIDRIGAGSLDEFRADVYVAALTAYAKRVSARAWLFAQTFDARVVAPRLAARLGIGAAMNVVDVTVDGDALLATCSAFGGDTRVVYRLGDAAACVLGIHPNAVRPEPLAGSVGALAVMDVAIDVGSVVERIRLVERPEATTGPRLEHAEIVVAGGRGLGSKENFRLVEELAAALGGMAGASRPIVDDGWAKPAQQVGLTGKITKPALYIAAGISGASQHVVGCTAAKRLVAINSDSSAAIFRYAHYGIVGNCLEILPALAEAARKNG
jgi:electron transfer flavoprotein alpha subunit